MRLTTILFILTLLSCSSKPDQIEKELIDIIIEENNELHSEKLLLQNLCETSLYHEPLNSQKKLFENSRYIIQKLKTLRKKFESNTIILSEIRNIINDSVIKVYTGDLNIDWEIKNSSNNKLDSLLKEIKFTRLEVKILRGIYATSMGCASLGTPQINQFSLKDKTYLNFGYVDTNTSFADSKVRIEKIFLNNEEISSQVKVNSIKSHITLDFNTNNTGHYNWTGFYYFKLYNGKIDSINIKGNFKI